MKPRPQDKISQIAAVNANFWISCIFFGQGVCALAFSRIVKIPREEIFLPILVLFLGGGISALFSLFNGSGGRYRWRWLIPAVCYGLFMTLMSNRGFSDVRVSFDTSYFHPVEYATLGLLLGNFWYWVIEEKGFAAFALRVFLAVGLFGFIDELHQLFVPGRDADIRDWVLDLAGGAIAILAIAAIRHLARSRVKTSPPPAG